MKYLLYLILVSFVFALSSCGDDNTTNTPVVPPGTVLYSMDTIAAEREAGSTGSTDMLYYFLQTISASQVSIEFRLQSNVDSSLGSSGSYRDSTNGTMPPSPVNYNLYAPIDSAYSYTCNVSTQPFYAGFNVRLVVLQIQSVQRYVRFVNVKVTKVQ